MSSHEDLAGEVLIVGFPGTSVPDAFRELSDRGALGGYVLFKRNLGSLDAVRALTDSLRGPADAPCVVAVDQEGGRVARFGPPVLKLPPMRDLARGGDLALLRDAGEHLGKQLRALGFTMDFAPVLDVDTNPQNPIIGDRAFGTTPDEVIPRALAFADGLESAGVASCGKHFPGHGDTAQDSHLDLPKLPHDRARLDRVELAPFRAAVGRVPAMMSAHVVFEAIEPALPATLCRAVMHDLLRGELGWGGVTISDDLEMKAIADHVGAERAASMAIEAGCDALLVCSDPALALRIRAGLAERASGDAAFRARLEDAAARLRAMRVRYGLRAPVDAAVHAAAFDRDATAALEARIADHVERNRTA